MNDLTARKGQEYVDNFLREVKDGKWEGKEYGYYKLDFDDEMWDKVFWVESDKKYREYLRSIPVGVSLYDIPERRPPEKFEKDGKCEMSCQLKYTFPDGSTIMFKPFMFRFAETGGTDLESAFSRASYDFYWSKKRQTEVVLGTTFKTNSEEQAREDER
jgi:hypothetical protein